MKIRDEQGFHVDPGPVLRWLDEPARGDTITLHSAEATSLDTLLFDASAQVLNDAMPAEARSEQFGKQLAHFARTLPLLTEAMIAGFMCFYVASISFMDGIETEKYTVKPMPMSTETTAFAIRPIGTTWSPFFVGLLSEEAEEIAAQLCLTPEAGGPVEDVGLLPRERYPGWWIRLSKLPAAPTGDKLCLVCKQTPGPMIFGQIGGPCYALILSRTWRPSDGVTPPPPPPTVVG
jgi:hypothetical protein